METGTAAGVIQQAQRRRPTRLLSNGNWTKRTFVKIEEKGKKPAVPVYEEFRTITYH